MFKSLISILCFLGPLLMSLKPGSQIAESFSDMKAVGNSLENSLDTRRSQGRPCMLQLAYIQDQLEAKESKEDSSHTVDDRIQTPVTNGEDATLCSPPRTENEVLDGFAFSHTHTQADVKAIWAIFSCILVSYSLQWTRNIEMRPTCYLSAESRVHVPGYSSVKVVSLEKDKLLQVNRYIHKWGEILKVH